MYRETYSTARGVLSFLVAMGWIVAGVGAILLLVGLSSATGRPYSADTAPVLFALVPGKVLIIAGLTQVALAQRSPALPQPPAPTRVRPTSWGSMRLVSGFTAGRLFEEPITVSTSGRGRFRPSGKRSATSIA